MDENSKKDIDQDKIDAKYYKAIERYELDSLDQKILKMEVQYPDIKGGQIAAYLKISQGTVSRKRNKPAYRKALAEFHKTTGEWIVDLGRHMFRRLRTLINDEDKDIALQAIKITAPLVMNYENSQGVGAVIREERITFRTTVQADGSLLQEAIREEMENPQGLPEQKPDIVDVL